MYLAIGDVVRVRKSQTLGTVSGIASHTSGSLVELQTSERAPRAIVSPRDLELVARSSKPMTTSRAVATLIFFALAVAAAVGNARSLNQHHVGLPLTFFVALTSGAAVSSGLHSLFNRPRRVHV